MTGDFAGAFRRRSPPPPHRDYPPGLIRRAPDIPLARRNRADIFNPPNVKIS
jgi:hypothetical protein